MSDIKLDDGLVTIEGDTNIYTVHGGNSHFGLGPNGNAFLSFGAKGGLSVRTFDGSNYSEKVRVGGDGKVTINGQLDLLTGSGGNTHFGLGANGNAFLSFGAGGSLTIRTFDGSSYKDKVHIDGNGNVSIKNQAGQETIRLNGATGDIHLSGTLSVGTGATALNVGTALGQALTRIQALETKLAALEAKVAAPKAR